MDCSRQQVGHVHKRPTCGPLPAQRLPRRLSSVHLPFAGLFTRPSSARPNPKTIFQHPTALLSMDASSMDPESCGCLNLSGQLYLPTNCQPCGASMRTYDDRRPPSSILGLQLTVVRVDCLYCRGTGFMWIPCPHRQSVMAQASLSGAFGGAGPSSSYGGRRSSQTGSSSHSHAARLSRGTPNRT